MTELSVLDVDFGEPDERGDFTLTIVVASRAVVARLAIVRPDGRDWMHLKPSHQELGDDTTTLSFHVSGHIAILADGRRHADHGWTIPPNRFALVEDRFAARHLSRTPARIGLLGRDHEDDR